MRYLRFLVLGLVALMTLFAGPVPLTAATTFTVDSTGDAVDANPGDGTCATAGAVCTLRASIQEANALGGADTITLLAGTYTLSIAGAGEDASTTGDLDITDDVMITGAGAINTIIDGAALDRVFHVVGPIDAKITRVAIQSGNALPAGGGIGPMAGGAGILNEGTLTLTDVTVSGNDTEIEGGGIFNDGTLTVIGSTVSGNRARGGGGIENSLGGTLTLIMSSLTSNGATFGGGITNRGTATMTDSTISSNAAGGGAGGIENKTGTLTLTGSTVSGNTAFSYGGIFNDGTLIITNSVITGNMAEGNGGITTSGRLTLDSSTVSDNAARDGSGGGIAIGTSTVAITNSTIARNSATEDGGGILSVGGITSSTVNITNSTVSGNSADGNGGGIHNFIGSMLNLNNVTITGNTGARGGINNEGDTVHFSNSIIASNTDTGGQAPDCFGPVISQGYNLIQNTTGCSISGDTTGNITGQDPNLGPLAENGGPTQTHALLAGSPAIDSGNPATPGSGGNACEGSDQRGVARPRGTACDIGAHESEFTQPPPTPGPPEFPKTGGEPAVTGSGPTLTIVFLTAADLGLIGITAALIGGRRRS